MEPENGEHRIDTHERALQILKGIENDEKSPIQKIDFPEITYHSDEAFSMDDYDIGNCLWPLCEWHNAPLITDTFTDRETRAVWKNELYDSVSATDGEDIAMDLNSTISTSKLAKITEMTTVLAYLPEDKEESVFSDLRNYIKQLPWNEQSSGDELLKNEDALSVTAKYDQLSSEEKETIAREIDALVVPIQGRVP